MKHRILWLDCSSGISGDMLIGALISAGVPFKRLEAEILDKIPLKKEKVRIRAGKVRRMGLAATKFDVIIPPGGARDFPFTWGEIEWLVEKSALPEGIRQKGLDMIKSLFEAEAKIHGFRSIRDVHLHELGSPDTIIDIFGALVCLDILGVEEVYCSPVNLGGGTVDTRHGKLPVPAPATALLLTGVPVYGGRPPFELCTPTGAALLKGLAKGFGPMPLMKLVKCGVGAGAADFKDTPNVLRAFAGESFAFSGVSGGDGNADVIVLETNIDDMNPQIYGYLMERLFKAGALDVFLTPIIMKKSRPAVKITALCDPGDAPRVEEIMFSETTTLGIRFYRAGRSTLPRKIETINTEFGPIRFKTSSFAGKEQKTPEYEDCLKTARKTGLPLKEIFRRLQSPPSPARKRKKK